MSNLLLIFTLLTSLILGTKSCSLTDSTISWLNNQDFQYQGELYTAGYRQTKGKISYTRLLPNCWLDYCHQSDSTDCKHVSNVLRLVLLRENPHLTNIPTQFQIILNGMDPIVSEMLSNLPKSTDCSSQVKRAFKDIKLALTSKTDL